VTLHRQLGIEEPGKHAGAQDMDVQDRHIISVQPIAGDPRCGLETDAGNLGEPVAQDAPRLLRRGLRGQGLQGGRQVPGLLAGEAVADGAVFHRHGLGEPREECLRRRRLVSEGAAAAQVLEGHNTDFGRYAVPA